MNQHALTDGETAWWIDAEKDLRTGNLFHGHIVIPGKDSLQEYSIQRYPETCYKRHHGDAAKTDQEYKITSLWHSIFHAQFVENRDQQIAALGIFLSLVAKEVVFSGQFESRGGSFLQRRVCTKDNPGCSSQRRRDDPLGTNEPTYSPSSSSKWFCFFLKG